MQWLAALCVKRPVFATVLILSLTVIGAFSFTRLGVDRFPKVDFPTVVVTTVQPGAAPEQIETEVSDKIEEAVNTISGIDELRSISSEGVSQVMVSFVLEKDPDVAAQEVRDKVNGVLPLLPKTIQQPRVDRFDPDAAPVLSLALSANKPVRDITEYADKVLRRQLESVNGVGQVLILGYHLRQVRDTSEFIEASIHNVEEHLIVGSILAALVVLLFLTNLRSTIISAIAIPTSIVATFGLVWYMGFTLNLMTMLALTLSVGIVIDDAIVVLENIYRFIEEKHDDQMHAAIDATKEIGLAVLATTMSLIAIFVPVGFMGGIVGRFMKSFGLTMAFAIAVSLIVSFTLTPMLSARWLKVNAHGKDKHSSKDSRVFHAVDLFYTRLL